MLFKDSLCATWFSSDLYIFKHEKTIIFLVIPDVYLFSFHLASKHCIQHFTFAIFSPHSDHDNKNEGFIEYLYALYMNFT